MDTLGQSIFGLFQGRSRRHLLDYTTKTNADASILSGNVGTHTLRQSVLGYNQGRSLLDYNTKVGCPGRPIDSGQESPTDCSMALQAHCMNQSAADATPAGV